MLALTGLPPKPGISRGLRATFQDPLIDAEQRLAGDDLQVVDAGDVLSP
jgi:hypothetical protein